MLLTVVRPAGIHISSRPVQSLNACAFSVVTVFGIVILVNNFWLLNCILPLDSIAVTVYSCPLLSVTTEGNSILYTCAGCAVSPVIVAVLFVVSVTNEKSLLSRKTSISVPSACIEAVSSLIV